MTGPFPNYHEITIKSLNPQGNPHEIHEHPDEHPHENRTSGVFCAQVLDQLPERVCLCSRQGAAHLDDVP